MKQTMFNLTFLNEEGEEETVEVFAYSKDQARFLADCNGTVVNVEEAVVKGSAIAAIH